MSEHLDLIRTLGGIRETGGRNPILLDRPDRVWIVETGHVDIFSVRLEDGRPTGVRRHFQTVSEGDILFGASSPESLAGGLLAVGSLSTVLRETGVGAFLGLLEDPAKSDEIERLIRRWIRNASLAVGGKEIMPGNSGALSGSGRAVLPKGGCVHPSFKTLWVSVESGRAVFMGRTDFPVVPRGRPFPLIRGAWLRAVDDASLSFSEEWPDSDNLRKSLDLFNRFILYCSSANSRRTDITERTRMTRREESKRAMRSRGIARLASVLKRSNHPVAAETSRTDPLQAACRMVGEASGVKVSSPHSGTPDPGGGGETLEDIARASGFRTRQVALRDGWWKRDSGPLLVYRETDARPLAAIPVSPRRYELLDPFEGTACRVDRAAAGSLSGSAHVFYRPFPNEPLTGMDLLRFGLHGSLRDLGTLLLAGICGACLSLTAPWMTGLLFDAIIPEAEGGQLLQFAAVLVAGAFAVLLFDITKGIALLRIESRTDGSVQAALWDRLLSLPVPFFAGFTAGDLAERSMGVSMIRSMLSGAAAGTVLSGLFSLVNLVLLFRCSPSLAWVAVGLMMAGLLVVFCMSLLLVRYEERVFELEGRNQGIVLQLVSGIAKLRVSGSEDGAFSLWADTFAEKKKHSFRAGRLECAMSSFNAVYPVLSLMAVYAWLSWKLEGRLSTGGFLAFSAAFASLQFAVLQTGTAIITSLGIVPIFKRLKPIVEAVPESDDTREKPGVLRGGIEVSRLTYRYSQDGPTVLRDVSLRVEPGEFVAVVGSSGSGKSTLLRLLLGFAKPDAGAIYYDGRDLSTLDVRSIRRQTGTVLQNSRIMPGDIRSAILGSSKLTLDDAWEAARLAGLDEDIREMPMGMYTMIPAGGGTLSGGQRQRLAIARAIAGKPRILFFDEATSALDNRTQAVVARSLEGLQVSRLVIAHRLSTVVNADRIYVLERGEVAEHGTYEELMELGGVFAGLAKRQLV